MTATPTSLTLSSDKKNSHFICIMPCCFKGTFTPNVIVTQQGGFQEKEEETLLSKVGALFQKFCCCCCKKKEAADKKEPYKQPREESARRVTNSLQIALPGAPPLSEGPLQQEAAAEWRRAAPHRKEHTAAGALLQAQDFHLLQEERKQRTLEKVSRTADPLRPTRARERLRDHPLFIPAQATPVADLLPHLVPFIIQRSGSTHREKDRFSTVNEELRRHGYAFSESYINLIIENAVRLGSTPLQGTHLALFESIFQVAAGVSRP